MSINAEQAKATLARAQEGIGSRFETQTSIDEANAQRDKEWKEAYARIGQEPPKRPEVVHDGRTLFERLEEQKRLKDEEWDQKMKLGNQYRGLIDEEFQFLNARAKEKQDREQKAREQEDLDVMEYREALAARHAREVAAADAAVEAQAQAQAPVAGPSKPPAPRIPPKPVKKDVKSLMKGIVVKKKPKPEGTASGSGSSTPSSKPEPAGAGQAMSALGVRLGEKRTADEPPSDADKRQKKD